jgi:hypothetical protein
VSEQFRSKQTYPFMMIPHKIWEIGLTGNEIAVFLRIFYRAGFEHECFESRTSIAEACCLSEKTVSNCFAELERLNILQITRRRVENKPNLITINHCDEWLSKRKNFPSEDRPQVKSTLDLEKNLPEAREKITYGTRVPELDSIEQDSFLNTVATAEAAAPQKAIEPEVLIDEPRAKAQKPAGSLIFEAYREAYLRRYNVEPLRNAKTNGICSQIAKQLPLDEAIALMHFFLQQNVAFYIQRGHAIQLALGDLQALRTNMLNNQAMSSRQAQLADKQQAQKNALQNYLENREKYALK